MPGFANRGILALPSTPSTTAFDLAKITTGVTLSDLNLKVTHSGAAGGWTAAGTVASKNTGKIYFEGTIVTINSIPGWDLFGLANAAYFASLPSVAGNLGSDAATSNSWGYSAAGAVIVNTATVATIQTMAPGDTSGFAIDVGGQKIWIKNITAASGWNNDVIGNQDPANGIGGISFAAMAAGPYFAAVNAGFDTPTGDVLVGNFGGSAYVGTAPSGFGNL